MNIAVTCFGAALFVISFTSAACDKAELSRHMHWSANDAGLPLENNVADELARIEQKWPGTNNGAGMAQCRYREGRKCMIQQARDALDKGFHAKAAAIGRATQMHNAGALRFMGTCTDQEISDAIGGT